MSHQRPISAQENPAPGEWQYFSTRLLSRAISGATCREDLFEQVCQALLSQPQFCLAWIGWRDPNTEQLVPVAQAGDHDGYLQAIRFFCDNRLEGQGPAGRAFRLGRPQVHNQLLSDPALPGFLSMVALPIRHEQEIVGTLTVYARRENQFQQGEIEMLTGAAEDLSLALDNLAREQMRQSAQAKLRHELDFSDALLSSLPGLLYLIDQSGRFLRWNRNLESVTGYSTLEIGQMNPLDFVPEDERELLSLRIQEVFVIGRAEVEATLLCKDGTRYPYHFTGSRTLMDGQPCLLGVGLDISESKHVQEERAASQERYRLLASLSNDAIWDFEPGTGTICWNDGFQKLTGFCAHEKAADLATWVRMFHPEERESVFGQLQLALESSQQRWSQEHRIQCRDGGYAWVLHRAYLIRDPEGRCVRLLGSLTDLTLQKKAQERIVEQAALIDQARDAIIVHDLDHKVISWSKGATRVFGWSEDEVIGRSLLEVLQDDPAVFRSASVTTMEQESWRGEIVKKSKSGDPLVVDSRWSLVRNSQGQPKAVLTLGTDITERKKIEAQFLRAQRMESIGTLAGGVAHDLNNILTPILMSAALMRTNEVDEDKLEGLSLIECCAQRGADMVKQVLAFARGVEGKQLSIQIQDLIGGALKIVKETFPKNILVEVDIPKDLWAVLGDATQLQQVLLNLCVNSRDAMPNGGRLTLACSNEMLDEHYAALAFDSQPGPYVCIRLEDTGTGMNPELMEKIYDPFFTTKDIGKGTGLGLSTSLAIVKSHSGFLRCYSEPGAGTRFEIYLPGHEVTFCSQQAGTAQELPRGHGELILMVDDEPAIRQITSRILLAFGYRVLLAEDGAEALALYADRRKEIALVLTDMMMPILDGASTIRALRRMSPSLPIIASSGLSAHGEAVRVVNAGVEHFLPKPYSAHLLLTTLRKALPHSLVTALTVPRP
jgi:PAS domain S-box-containing protein